MSSREDLGVIHIEPGLGLLRLAALSACTEQSLDDETLDLMFEEVQTGVVARVAPAKVWPELAQGLMGKVPSNMIAALRNCGALAEVLPEVAALYGVPQIADDPPQVDIGVHLQRTLDKAAHCNAPLSVRFAVLVMNVGKADSPREHWPVHYRHVERGRPRIEALCARFAVPGECRDLALLALAETERVHRVGEVRAGPVAALLERVGAFTNPQRFEQLMTLCACDYRACKRGATQEDYPKAALLERAVNACLGVVSGEAGAGEGAATAADRLQDARAAAIARALCSERWSSLGC